MILTLFLTLIVDKLRHCLCFFCCRLTYYECAVNFLLSLCMYISDVQSINRYNDYLFLKVIETLIRMKPSLYLCKIQGRTTAKEAFRAEEQARHISMCHIGRGLSLC